MSTSIIEDARRSMVSAAFPDEWADLLREAQSGLSLFLATSTPGSNLTIGSLAGLALTRSFHAQGMESPPGPHLLLTSAPGQEGRNGGLLDMNLGLHEFGWMAAGSIYEELLAKSSEQLAVTHLFFLDPWTTNLGRLAREIYPKARRILLSDLKERAYSNEPEYWKNFEAWLDTQEFSTRLDARKFLGLVPEELWNETANAAMRTEELQRALCGNRELLVIDESSDSPPALEAVDELVSLVSDKLGICLLTPHLGLFRTKAPKVLERIEVALNTPDLTPRTYASILRCASAYCAPSDFPFGKSPRNLLSAARTIATNATEAIRRLGDSADFNQAKPAASAGGRSRSGESANTALVPNNEGALGSWWKELREVIPKNRPAKAGEIAILTCCYKYLQRFRVFLDSIVRQDYPLEQIELCVAAPGNPDGLLDYLALAGKAFPKLRLRVVEVPEEMRRNRGKMINVAFDASAAPKVMVADCDIVLPPDFMKRMLPLVESKWVLGCFRTPLSEEVTAHVVTGNLDPVRHFEELKQSWDPREAPGVREGVLGYCQVLTREAFASVRYPEDFEMINQSDIVFVERLAQRFGAQPRFLEDIHVLHLAHPRDWSGTKVFL